MKTKSFLFCSWRKNSSTTTTSTTPTKADAKQKFIIFTFAPCFWQINFHGGKWKSWIDSDVHFYLRMKPETCLPSILTVDMSASVAKNSFRSFVSWVGKLCFEIIYLFVLLIMDNCPRRLEECKQKYFLMNAKRCWLSFGNYIRWTSWQNAGVEF